MEAALRRVEHLLQDPTPARWGDLVRALESDGHCAIVMLLSALFAVPLLPGMSTPAGIAIIGLGWGYALNRPPWLPRKLAERTLPRESLRRIVRKCRQWRHRAGRFLRPRGTFIPARWRRLGVGGLFALMGIELALPLPFPGTNTLPALSLLALAMGALESDDLWLGAGFLLAGASTAYLALIAASPALLLKLWH